MIKDYTSVKKGEVFHFPHSLRPFVLIFDGSEDRFLDIDEWESYSYDDIVTWEGLDFYKKDSDSMFLGVDVVYTVANYFAKV